VQLRVFFSYDPDDEMQECLFSICGFQVQKLKVKMCVKLINMPKNSGNSKALSSERFKKAFIDMAWSS